MKLTREQKNVTGSDLEVTLTKQKLQFFKRCQIDGIAKLHTSNACLEVRFIHFFFSKDDPFKFTFWKKRLRDLREDLKKDALEKLKAECPTLFNMGWFKVFQSINK